MQDLRRWLSHVDDMGELHRVSGADWNLEIGAFTEVANYELGSSGRRVPAFLFDDVPGYPSGFRVLTSMVNSNSRLALTLGLEPSKDMRELVLSWRDRLKSVVPVAYETHSHGPVLENTWSGDEIDLCRFPVPKWSERDGGRYIGTGCAVMTRDPDDGTINSGTYRVMIHDRNTLGLWISPGKDGDLHLKKYAERGEVAPISMTFGQSPLLYLAASKEIPHCEFDWVGGVMGEPLEVVAGDNGMPIPRYAEIAIEGEVRPGDKRQEGPFGEWTGYYASGEALAHVVHVNRVHFRHDPILTGSPSSKPPSEHTFSSCFMRSGMIWDELERSGVPDVTGVWCHPSGGGRMFTAVSIKQRYAGHATQAGMIATHGRASSYLGRYVVVVDEDIDVFNLTDVMWAVASRSDPSRDIRVMPDCRSGPLDPIIPPDRKGLNSRAVIDACRPYEWKDQFPPVATCGPELRRSVLQKWGDVIAGL